MNDNNSPTPVKEDQKLASYIAMVVRNAMEDFHCEHLTDDQMKQLNGHQQTEHGLLYELAEFEFTELAKEIPLEHFHFSQRR